MIKLPAVTPSLEVIATLRKLQDEIDALQPYPNRVEQAKVRFGQENRKTSPLFRQVRASLKQMCAGAQRCCYCEDSVGDEVEHIKPKAFYPDQVFDWDNYLMACGPCNGPKNNKYAIFRSSDGSFFELVRKKNQVHQQRPGGECVLINPRIKNPLEFLELEMQNTFFFLPLKNLQDPKKRMANYTIELLRLNIRDELVAARRSAFGSFKARLFEYTQKKTQGANVGELFKLITGIQNMPHPTVWKEMQRQSNNFQELSNLFAVAPEAYTW